MTTHLAERIITACHRSKSDKTTRWQAIQLIDLSLWLVIEGCHCDFSLSLGMLIWSNNLRRNNIIRVSSSGGGKPNCCGSLQLNNNITKYLQLTSQKTFLHAASIPPPQQNFSGRNPDYVNLFDDMSFCNSILLSLPLLDGENIIWSTCSPTVWLLLWQLTHDRPFTFNDLSNP